MTHHEIDGRRLEYQQIEGDPDLPALVFLHEGLGSVAQWRDFPRCIAECTDRRVLIYSRFGHGHSDPPDTPRTPRFMHDEALETLPWLLDRLAIREPILVGHSDGASISLIYASRADQSVSGLVLLAPHVFVEEISIQGISAAKRAFEETDLSERMSRYHRDPEATFRRWVDIWLSPAFREWNIEDRLADVTCPVLIIQGDQDQYGSLEQVTAIERGVGGPVERVVLPCEHAPHRDMPEETLTAIARFVRTLADGKANASLSAAGALEIAQLVALNLAGKGSRKILDELHQMWIFVTPQSALAPGPELLG